MNVHGRDGLGTALVLSVGNIKKKEGEKENSQTSAYVLCKATIERFVFFENMCLCVGNIENNLVPPPDKPA